MTKREELAGVSSSWLPLLLLAAACATTVLRLLYRWAAIEPDALSSALAFVHASVHRDQVRELIAGVLRAWLCWCLPALAASAFAAACLRCFIRRSDQWLSPHVLASVTLLIWLAIRSSLPSFEDGSADVSVLESTYHIPSSRFVLMGATSLSLLFIAARSRVTIAGALCLWLFADTTQGLLANLAIPSALGDATGRLGLLSLATTSHWIATAAGTSLLGLTLLSLVSEPHDARVRWARRWLPVIVAAWLGALPLHANARQSERAVALRFETAAAALDVNPLAVEHGEPWRPTAFAVVAGSGEIWLGEQDRFVRVSSTRALPAIRDSELVLFVDQDARVSDLNAALARVPRGTKVSLGRLSAAAIVPAARARFAVAQDVAVSLSSLRIYRDGDYIPDKMMREGNPEPTPSVWASLSASDQLVRTLPSNVDYLLTDVPPAPLSEGRWQRAPQVALSPPPLFGGDSCLIVMAVTLLTLATLFALRNRANE